MNKNIENRILTILESNIQGDIITINDSLKHDLGVDSISMIKIMNLMCFEFNIDITKISDLEILKIDTIQNLIDVILIKT